MHSSRMPGCFTWMRHHGGGSSCRWKMRTMELQSFGVTQLVEWASVWWFSHRLRLAVHRSARVLTLVPPQ